MHAAHEVEQQLDVRPAVGSGRDEGSLGGLERDVGRVALDTLEQAVRLVESAALVVHPPLPRLDTGRLLTLGRHGHRRS